MEGDLARILRAAKYPGLASDVLQPWKKSDEVMNQLTNENTGQMTATNA